MTRTVERSGALKSAATIQKIIELLKDARIERQCAAAMVLGELGNREVVPALCEALGDGDPLLARYAMESLDALGAHGQAAPYLVPLLEATDPDVRARATAMLAASGARGASALARALDGDFSRARKHAVVSILAQQHSPAAQGALLATFADPGLSDVSLSALRAEIDRMDERGRAELAARATAHLREAKDPTALAHLVRLLGYLGDPGSIKLLLGYAAGKHPPPVRAAAVAALRRPIAHAADQKSSWAEKLLELCDDADETVAKEALGTLAGMTLPEEVGATLLKLASSARHGETRKFAVERVGDAHLGAKQAAELIAKLESTDAAVRDAATRSLARLEAAIAPLTKALLGARGTDLVRRLAAILRHHQGRLPEALREKVADRAMELLEAHDPLADEVLEAVRHLSPKLFVERIEARALELSRKGRPAEAWKLLRRLTNAGAALADDTRYLVATVGVKVAGKELLRAARTTEPALAQIASLLDSGFPLARRLCKDRELEPDHLFVIGFNFSESSDPDEKDFGAALLSHLAERSPRSKIGKSAKNKLKLIGWAEQ